MSGCHSGFAAIQASLIRHFHDRERARCRAVEHRQHAFRVVPIFESSGSTDAPHVRNLIRVK